MSKIQCSCIIPFYNENTRLLTVLDQFTQLQDLLKIILVDDGSTDNTVEMVGSSYPQLEICSLSTNQGKAAAVAAGLKQVRTPWVMLFDADIKNFQVSNLRQVIQKTFNQNHVSLVILRQLNDPWLYRLLGIDFLRSGERILRTQDLQAVIKTQPVHYQLELAINKYYLDNPTKKVAWAPFHSTNHLKLQKWSFKTTLIKTWQANSHFFHHHYFNQLKSFKPQPLFPSTAP